MAITLPFVFVFLCVLLFFSFEILFLCRRCTIVWLFWFIFFSILFALRTNGWPWRRQVATSLSPLLLHWLLYVYCYFSFYSRIRWLRERYSFLHSVICFAAICHPLRGDTHSRITLACGLSCTQEHMAILLSCFFLSFYFYFRSYWIRSKINVYDNVQLEFFPQKI